MICCVRCLAWASIDSGSPVAVELATVGFHHFGVARTRLGLEHAISLCERLGPGAGSARGLPAEAAALDAQHRLDLRELELGDAGGGRDALHDRPHRTLQVVARQRSAHLNLEEDAQDVRPPPAYLAQLPELAAEIEIGLLAGREQLDRRTHLRGFEPQLRHDGTRSGDFLLGHAPVGLGDAAHDAEGGAEEALADRGYVRRRRAAPGLIGPVFAPRLVEVVAQQHTDGSADELPHGAAHDPGAQNEPDQSAGQFAVPFHAGRHVNV